MNDLTLALAYIGAYCLGIITVLFTIYFWLIKLDEKAEAKETMAMAAAVGVVKESMPGSTVLDYSKTQ